MKRSTRAALAAAAVALVIPASGCASLLSAQQTAKYQYNGGDGAWNVENEDVKVRGLLLIANDDDVAQVFFTVVNNSADPADVEISVGSASVSQTVPAGGRWVQNPENKDSDSEPLLTENYGGKPGDKVDVDVTIDGETEVVRAQVLNGAQPDYKDLEPTGAPGDETAGSGEMQTPGADGEATEQPAG
ncbi:hypothetical protein [Brevibacterium otitidis]|uniref:Lipoprotein n=1 Tax=Brevibacterium otitidis TaxID=53364 RepID=A0ABV5X7D7_9MICO|nr:hypothetical protein GCM10023233_03570 [Brevibacterium otitidis]